MSWREINEVVGDAEAERAALLPPGYEDPRVWVERLREWQAVAADHAARARAGEAGSLAAALAAERLADAIAEAVEGEIDRCGEGLAPPSGGTRAIERAATRVAAVRGLRELGARARDLAVLPYAPERTGAGPVLAGLPEGPLRRGEARALAAGLAFFAETGRTPPADELAARGLRAPATPTEAREDATRLSAGRRDRIGAPDVALVKVLPTLRGRVCLTLGADELGNAEWRAASGELPPFTSPEALAAQVAAAVCGLALGPGTVVGSDRDFGPDGADRTTLWVAAPVEAGRRAERRRPDVGAFAPGELLALAREGALAADALSILQRVGWVGDRTRDASGVEGGDAARDGDDGPAPAGGAGDGAGDPVGTPMADEPGRSTVDRDAADGDPPQPPPPPTHAAKPRPNRRKVDVEGFARDAGGDPATLRRALGELSAMGTLGDARRVAAGPKANRRRAAARAYVAWATARVAEGEGAPPPAPSRPAAGPEVSPEPPRVDLVGVLAALVEPGDDDGPADVRKRAILGLMTMAGASDAEVVVLRVRDFDDAAAGADAVVTLGAKARDKRDVACEPALARAIRHHLDETRSRHRTGDSQVFGSATLGEVHQVVTAAAFEIGHRGAFGPEDMTAIGRAVARAASR